MHNLGRYLVFCILAMAGGLPQAHAQAFPTRSIRLVVPYQTGGLPDVMARMVAQKMSETIGQSVIVDNRSGASGIIAAEYVAKSPPDGYTLFVADIGHFAINPAIYRKLSYDPNRDFTPITTAVHGPLMLVANAGLQANNVAELIALAKTKPGKINFGSPGNGSVHQLAMAQFALQAKIELVHIPYRSNAQSIPALLADDVSIMFVSPPSVNEHVKAGKLKILAVGAEERTPLAPGVPTVAEAGFPGFSAVTTVGFLAPAGTPPDIVKWLNREMVKALRSPEVEAKMPILGVAVVGDAPEEFGRRIRADQEYYRELVERVGIKID